MMNFFQDIEYEDKYKILASISAKLEDTVRSNFRQVVFSITLNFSLVFTQDGLPELGSSFKEIFLVAPQKLIIFHPILHQEFRRLLENLFK